MPPPSASPFLYAIGERDPRTERRWQAKPSRAEILAQSLDQRRARLVVGRLVEPILELAEQRGAGIVPVEVRRAGGRRAHPRAFDTLGATRIELEAVVDGRTHQTFRREAAAAKRSAKPSEPTARRGR